MRAILAGATAVWILSSLLALQGCSDDSQNGEPDAGVDLAAGDLTPDQPPGSEPGQPDLGVDLGPDSGAELGRDETLPTLTCSVGAFTRLWLGVRPATGLAVTDELRGPEELLRELDRVLLLPEPRPDWDF